jgi:hypothetical protein
LEGGRDILEGTWPKGEATWGKRLDPCRKPQDTCRGLWNLLLGILFFSLISLFKKYLLDYKTQPKYY